MAYAAWSVVFGETPSASKWNILGTNDAAFNDGSGIPSAGAATNAVATDEGTTSASFTDLATVGPTVTVPIGASGKALAIWGCGAYNVAAVKLMGVAVSGATTIAANAVDSIRSDANTFELNSPFAKLFTGLNMGNNTFTAKYQTASGTGRFFARYLIVIPV